MKTLILVSMLCFVANHAYAGDELHDFSGKWVFDRFEYVGYVTTDCEETAARIYQNAEVNFGNQNFDIKESGTPNTYVIKVTEAGKYQETYHYAPPDTLYIFEDGCRFYFKQKNMGVVAPMARD